MRALFLLILLTPSASLADHICTNSPNEVPIGMTQGGQGQAPVPICRWVQSGEAPQQRPPQTIVKHGIWEDRWGAIAVDGTGKMGVSKDERSERDAERAARLDCVNRGGDDKGCMTNRLRGIYKNQCVAYAWGAGVSMTRFGETLEGAERSAVEECSSDVGQRCEVFYSDCSEAVFLGFE